MLLSVLVYYYRQDRRAGTGSGDPIRSDREEVGNRRCVSLFVEAIRFLAAIPPPPGDPNVGPMIGGSRPLINPTERIPPTAGTGVTSGKVRLVTPGLYDGEGDASLILH
ncbi:MAG: hypothetical protein C4313_07305 [Thermoflexus sp.]